MFRVIVEEGASCMGGDESLCLGSFDTYEEALEQCAAVVNTELDKLRSLGLMEESLLRAYEARGVQPFILPASDPPFDAIAYAQSRIMA